MFCARPRCARWVTASVGISMPIVLVASLWLLVSFDSLIVKMVGCSTGRVICSVGLRLSNGVGRMKLNVASPALSVGKGSKVKRRGRRATQLELPLGATWGGRRKGAGRKPAPGLRRMEHRTRPVHRAAHPVHVTLRSVLRSLRHPFVFPTVRAAIRSLRELREESFRIVEFSVQGNHVHLLIEAADATALRVGVQSLVIRIARRVNRLLMRRGKVWADRFHARALTSPRAVRRALVYVLANHRKHAGGSVAALDPCSSAMDFEGFRERQSPCRAPRQRATSPPKTWLLERGWKRHGLISVAEIPSA